MLQTCASFVGVFDGNYDRFRLIADHEATHKTRVLSNKVDNDPLFGHAYEEYFTHRKNYYRQGLYRNHDTDIIRNINGYKFQTNPDYNLKEFKEKWWHFIFRLPRRY